GLLLALLDSGELLDEILADQLLMGYGVDVSLYGIPVYRAGVAATGAMPRQWLESTPMELHGAPWSLRVWPSAGLLEQKRSWAPAAVLTSSLLLAVAFGAGTKLTRDARERARDLEAAQRDLDRMQHLVNDLPACSRVGTRDARSLRYAVERQRFEPTLADHHAHLGGVMGVALDVTECEEAETALRASEERYRQFFEEDLTGDCIVDLEGRIHDCNPAFARTFGFGSVREALASDVPTLVPDREVRRRVLRDFHREGQLERYGFEARKTTGEPVYLIANAVAVHDEAGRVRQIRAYLFDDTERHQTEAQLRQSQKMEAVGRLAGGVAHDFNNLVTAINGYSDLLLARLRDDAPERTELEEIRRAGQRAAALTRQLLAFSRSQVLRPTVLDLNEVIDATGAMLHRLLGEDIRLVTRLTEDLAPVRADRGQLEQVLLNLAVNAQDAMPRGGELLVETSEEELDGTYVKRNVVVHPGTFVTLTVTDTGEGMPPDVLERVFEPFFTTKDSGKGTGLGLSTVYGIVKQTGGYIFGYSEPGEGTSFKVYLPRADTPVEANPLAETVATDQGRGERILVVEDEDAVRSLIGQILRLQGYDVIEAPNGRRGLEACSNGGRFDLVVTDVVMPDVRGPDLERQIRKVLPDVPMLFISGYPGEAIARRGELPEGTPFLQKPFTHDALTRKVRELLG
ncbi:MAG: ATP-binding protein, partial [Acidobacteriota bacterium]